MISVWAVVVLVIVSDSIFNTSFRNYDFSERITNRLIIYISLLMIPNALAFVLIGLFPFIIIRDFLFVPTNLVSADPYDIPAEGNNVEHISTSAFLHALYRWVIRLNMKHLLPLMVLVLFYSFMLWNPPVIWSEIASLDLDNRFYSDAFPVLLMIITFWLFCLTTGIATAVLPAWAAKVSGVICGWLLPVAGISIILGFMMGSAIYAADDLQPELDRLLYLMRHHSNLLTTILCILLALFLSLVLYIVSFYLMALRRRKNWT